MATLLSPSTSWRISISDLLAYRELILQLAYRDLKVKYAQTVLGLLWVFVKPLGQLLILTLVFDKFVAIDTGSIPYPLFALSGMAAWGYFAYLLDYGATSLINNQDIINRIYFPRVILPISKALVALVDMFVLLLLTYLMVAIFGFSPSWKVIFLPFFIIMATVIGLGLALWFSILTIRFRDLQQFIFYILNITMWMTPVAYPATIIPDQYKLIYYINPMAGIVEGFRWAILGTPFPSSWFLISFIIMGGLFCWGWHYFHHAEPEIADYI